MKNKTTEPFFVIQPVRFECTGCGRCCHGDPATHYIELLAGDRQRISQYLGISEQTFSRQYTVTDQDVGEGIRINHQGRCVFLNERGQCDIYPVRPLQCASYPFWPEIMHNRSSWKAEAPRCEGIGRGEPLEASRVFEQLRLFYQDK